MILDGKMVSEKILSDVSLLVINFNYILKQKIYFFYKIKNRI
jgi:hypothetical protein